MKAMEFVRAAGLAFVVLIVDVVLAVAVVYLWGKTQQHGHSEVFYQTGAASIQRWSTRIVGTGLIFFAAWAAARKRPPRQAYVFAIALVFFYAFLDGASVAFEHFFDASMGISLALKLLASLAGVGLATRRRAAPQAGPAIR
jgi:zinc transporter ZupT